MKLDSSLRPSLVEHEDISPYGCLHYFPNFSVFKLELTYKLQQNYEILKLYYRR